jgi:hypothetical protein
MVQLWQSLSPVANRLFLEAGLPPAPGVKDGATMKSIFRGGTNALLRFACVALMFLGAGRLAAQPGPGADNPFANFDPAQRQQRQMDRMRQAFAITNDTEWAVVQPLVQKVMDAQQVIRTEQARQMMDGALVGTNSVMDRLGELLVQRLDENVSDRQRLEIAQRLQQVVQSNQNFFSSFTMPSPEAEALRKALHANASAPELQAATAALQRVRKEHQAQLEKAQAELRAILTVRQEAVAAARGLL